MSDLAQIRRALGLLHSIILSGERLSPQAEDEYEKALDALARIEDADSQESSP